MLFAKLDTFAGDLYISTEKLGPAGPKFFSLKIKPCRMSYSSPEVVIYIKLACLLFPFYLVI